MIITPERDRVLDLYAVRRALASGRVRPHGMRIVADGTVENGTHFRINGWPEGFPIKGDGLPEETARIRASVTFPQGKPELRLRETIR